LPSQLQPAPPRQLRLLQVPRWRERRPWALRRQVPRRARRVPRRVPR